MLNTNVQTSEISDTDKSGITKKFILIPEKAEQEVRGLEDLLQELKKK